MESINNKIKLQKNNSNKWGRRKTDMYLFFDLLQITTSILDCTNKNSVYILIGATPEYLKPFFDYNKRSVFVLPFSDKPYGCLWPPYGLSEQKYSLVSAEGMEDYNRLIIPTIDNLKYYFEYLHTKTFLTRKFVNSEWKDIILIDSSAGQSIHGVSLFFNRYVGNIDINNKCNDYETAQPLKFIKLTKGTKNTNLNPMIAEKYNENYHFLNFDPKLIILLCTLQFYHRNYFMITEEYPRYVPSYPVYSWNKNPYAVYNDWPNAEVFKRDMKRALKNMQKLSKILNIFNKYKKNVNKTKKLLQIMKKLPLMIKEQQTILDSINENDDNLIDEMTNLLKNINNAMIIEKYNNIQF